MAVTANGGAPGAPRSPVRGRGLWPEKPQRERRPTGPTAAQPAAAQPAYEAPKLERPRMRAFLPERLRAPQRPAPVRPEPVKAPTWQPAREPVAVPSPNEVWADLRSDLSQRDLPSVKPEVRSLFEKIFWGEEVPENPESMRVLGQAALNMFWRWGERMMYESAKAPERVAFAAAESGAWVHIPLGGIGSIGGAGGSPYESAMLAALAGGEAAAANLQMMEAEAAEFRQTTPEEMAKYLREGEIGYTFGRYPERLSAFREDVAAGMSIQEAVEKHQDFWGTEFWMNAIIDPANVLPAQVMSLIWPGGTLAARAFGKGLGVVLGKTVGKLPVGDWLTALSKRSVQRVKAGQAADAITEVVLRMPGDEDVVANLDKVLRGNKAGFDVLSESTRKVVTELTEELQDDGVGSLGDLVTRYVPELADGWKEPAMQAVLRERPEYVPFLVKEAVSRRTAYKLGVPRPSERGVLGRTFDFTSSVLKEHWLGTNPAYMLGNMQDNTTKSLLTGHFINPFDLTADAKVVRYMGDYQAYVPTRVMDGFIADELGVGGLSRTAQIPMPGVGKPAEIVDFWSKAFGTNMRAKFPWLESVAPSRPGDLAKAFDLAESPGRLAGLLDKTNWASVVELGRGFSGKVERSARVQVFFDTFSRQLEGAGRPRLIQAASAAGLGDDVVRMLGDPSLVRSPNDILALADRLTAEVQPVTRLSSFLPGGAPQEMLGRMAQEVDDLQTAAIGAGTPEALDTLRTQVGELFDNAEKYARNMTAAGDFEEVLSNWRASKMREVVQDVLERSRTMADELLNMTRTQVAKAPDRAGVYWARYFDAKSDISQTVQQEVSRITRERATDLAPEVDTLLARYQEVTSEAGVQALNYEDWGAFGESLAALRGSVDEPWRAMWSKFLENPNVDDLDTINLAYDAAYARWEEVAAEAATWRDGFLSQTPQRITREVYEKRMLEIWKGGFDDVAGVWQDIGTKLGIEERALIEGLEIFDPGPRTEAQALRGTPANLTASKMTDLSEAAQGYVAVYEPGSGRMLVSSRGASHFELLDQLTQDPMQKDFYWYADTMKNRKIIRLFWDESQGSPLLVLDRKLGQGSPDEVVAALSKLKEAGVPGDMPVRHNVGSPTGDYTVGDTLDDLAKKLSAPVEPTGAVTYWSTDPEGELASLSYQGEPNEVTMGLFDPNTGALGLSRDPRVDHEALLGRMLDLEEAVPIAGEGKGVVRIFSAGSLRGTYNLDPAASARLDAIDDTIAALEAMHEAGFSKETTIVTMVGYPDNPAPGTISEVMSDLEAMRGAAKGVDRIAQYAVLGPGSTPEYVESLVDWDMGMGVFVPDEGRLVLGKAGVNHEDLVKQIMPGISEIEETRAVRLIKAPKGLLVDAGYADDEALAAALRALSEAGLPADTQLLVPNVRGTEYEATRSLGEWLRTLGAAPQAPRAELGPAISQQRAGIFTSEDLYRRFEEGPTMYAGGRAIRKLPEGWLPSQVDPLRRPGAYWGESYPYWLEGAPTTPRGWQPVETLPGETPKPTQWSPPSKQQLDDWLRRGNINAEQYDEYLMMGQRDAQAGFTQDLGGEYAGRLRDQATDILDRLGRWRDSVYNNLEGAIETRRVEAADAAQLRAALSGLGTQWADEIQSASVAGSLEVKRVLFDYAENQNWEEVLRYFVPFSKWQLRNPVLLSQIISKRPWLFSAITKFSRASEQVREEMDLTQRFEGTLPVPQAAQGWLPQLGPGAQAPQGVPQQGYWAFDPRSLVSLSGQFREPFISPGEEELTGWQRAASQAARVPEYLGMHFWPWLEYPLEEAGLYGNRPPWGVLGTPGRAIPAARRFEEQIAEARVPGSSWMREYNIRRRIAEMQAEGTVDAQTAAIAQYDPSNPVYQQAEQEVNRISDFMSQFRAAVPYGLKYSSPGEMAIRQRREQLSEMPETRAAYLRGQFPALRTYGRAIAGVSSLEQSQWMAQRDAINAKYDEMLQSIPPWHPRATELNRARWEEIDELGPQPEPYTGRGYEAKDKDSVLFQLEQQRPRADQYAGPDGSIDWEAYNAAEADYLRDIPALSAEMGIEITPDEYTAFRNRYRSPTELAWEMQEEQIGKGWERYGELRGLRAPERQRPMAPWGMEGQLAEPSLTREEITRGVPEGMLPWVESEVRRRLDAGWQSGEIATWLSGQGLPFEEVERVLEGEGFGPRRVGEFARRVQEQRPWLKGQGVYAPEWGDWARMRTEEMPGMFTPVTEPEKKRDEAVDWFYDLMPAQRDEVRGALRVPEGDEFSDWFDGLDPQAKQWALNHADYVRSIEPLPSEGERLDVELDMLRWSEYGGEWTDLMDKYYGDADSPRSKFWDYWYANKWYLNEGYHDDDVVQATLSKDVRSFLTPEAEDPLYVEALKRLEGYYDPEEAERWQMYPDLVDQAQQERDQFYVEFDYDEKPPDGEDREWWDNRTEYQKEHPVMMWFFWYDRYLEWWGDTEPGSARPIKPAPPTPMPTPMPTAVPKPAPKKKGPTEPKPPSPPGIPMPPPPPPGMGSWLDEGGSAGWLS